MTPDAFRRCALSLPEATEVGHMGHPDFRVGGKIFATLFTREDIEYGMVKLRPEQQRRFMSEHPKAFSPAAGAWGDRGATLVRLSAVKTATAKSALLMAWTNTAPKTLVEKFVPG